MTTKMITQSSRFLCATVLVLLVCISRCSVGAFLPKTETMTRFVPLSTAAASNEFQKRTLFSLSSSSQFPSKTRMSMWSNDDGEINGQDRFKACVPYILPLLDGEMFGRYIYERVPPLGFLDSLFIGPLHDFYENVPLLGLVIFLVLTLGTRGNTEMSRAVRFSAQQAALIDVMLIFPELIGSAFEGEDIPRYLVEPCMNFVWYTYMAMVVYCIYQNLRGKKPDDIPWISGYAELMVGPF